MIGWDLRRFGFFPIAAWLLLFTGSPTSALPSEWESLGYDDWHLNAIAKRLAETAGSPVSLKGVVVLPIAEANAFVSEDGFIVVTENLLNELDGPDQFAFVLAHELVHLIKGHPRNRETNPTRLDRIRTELERGTGGSVVGTTLDLLLGVVSSYYSRGREREADEEAIRLMALAGFRPSAALTCLRRLETRSGFLSWFLSHPFPAERVAIVAAQVRKWTPLTAPSPPIPRPPHGLPEVFIDLRWSVPGPLRGEPSAVWARSLEEASRIFWSALSLQAAKRKAPFLPARPWQRYRSRTLQLSVALNEIISHPLSSPPGWQQWIFRMTWTLSDPGHGKVLAGSDEKFVVSLNGTEPLSEALPPRLRPIAALRLAEFVIKTAPLLLTPDS